MVKPVILSVDDDAEVLRAVARDVRREFARDFRVVSADSGAAALEALRELQARGEPVALLLSDHRMPQMDGVEFLLEARGLVPDAKRVLLTAYADTDAAIRAINSARLDYYLLKPWDPPEENLYPVLRDLLDDWRGNYRAPFSGVRVVDSRWSPKGFELREFLSRNRIPFRFSEASSEEAQPLLESRPNLPLVILADGERLEDPGSAVLAGRLGLQTVAQQASYDLVIVGGGPAGLAAAVYGASEGLRTVLVEREAPGGQAGLSARIENYLGFPTGLSGNDLARRAVTQAQRFGVEILAPQSVKAMRLEGQYKLLTLEDGSELTSQAVIVATGVQWRRMTAPGFERLTGAGVYYGAGSTEALSCRDETVYVVGGANSAGQAAMNFSRYAKEVVILVRGSSLEAGMSQYLVDQINATPNIRVRLHTQVLEAYGEDHLEALCLQDAQQAELERVKTNHLFIFIGAAPSTAWLDGVVARDKHGFVLTGNPVKTASWQLERDPLLLETSAPGVFAVGDVRSGSVKRVASSVGEGSIAVAFVHQYLQSVGAA
jgi:thioredoxin reductase (NADPH)